MEESTFRIADHTVSETIDDETIVVNLLDGSYFSLLAEASAVWQALQSGNSHHLTPPNVRSSIRAFVENGLVIGTVPDEWPTSEGAPITKYTDMEQMLLLDPIHDVDEHGWPTPSPPS